jgi:transcriptional regulator with XRE-family HTH domain
MPKNMGMFFSYFESMQHRGDILRRRIDKSGYSKADIAKKLGISRNNLYYKLGKDDLEYDFLIEAYKVMKQDILEDFPELSKFIATPSAPHAQEPGLAYEPTVVALQDCRREVETWKNKYIQLMEEYNHVLKENRALQARQTG